MTVRDPAPYASVNAVKADFGRIYRQRDPRDYFGVLGSLDYIIPEVAAPVFLQLVDELSARRGRPVTILDVGCSYGVLSAVMRRGLTMDQLRDRYASPSLHSLTPDSLADRDAHYFEGWPRRGGMRFLGLDASAEAIGYAGRVGLIDDGIAADLESGPLDDRARRLVAGADLIVSTGAVGYVTERTFSKLLSAFEAGSEPWVANFVLRVFDYAAVSAALAERGLATERFEGATFVQRRFRDHDEYQSTLRLLRAAGVDPAGKEAEGLFHAELFVSRPGADADEAALSEIISLSNSGHGRFGRRLRPLGPFAGAGLAA